MITCEIEKITNRNNLSVEESYTVMEKIMNGEVNDAQISALLAGLKTKGESPEEIAGFVKAMNDKSAKINIADGAVDVCGTGGDKSGTFNISTAAAFVVAGAGVKVAKHGNRSISSNCGSADVLAELGINISLSPSHSRDAINDIGISFLFAPNHHPAMKNVMPVRKNIVFKTVFNILGPLVNPANTRYQLIGTYNNQISTLMAESLKHLDFEKVCFVCTENKYDEIILNGESQIVEFSKINGIKKYSINHKTFKYPEISLKAIQGNSASDNAKILTELFTNPKKTSAFYVVAANAAMGLYSANFSDNLKVCRDAAEDSLVTGKALEKLLLLKEYGAKVN